MIEFKKSKDPIFIPVTGLDMQQIAHHVKTRRGEDADIEFVDLSGIFDETDPDFDTHIDKLQPIMNVKKAIDFENDGVPNEIRFVVPNANLPPETDEQLMDLGFTMLRYAYINAMPDELQNVVRAYIAMRHGVALDAKRFVTAVELLAKKTTETFVDPDVA